jgi:hypothetical protein
MLEVQVERLDQLLVLLDVGGVAAQEHALVAGLSGLEEILLALEPLPRLELGVLLEQVLRDEPADVALDAQRPAVDDRACLLDVLGVLVGVLPVLEHRVDLAVGHRLEDRDLRDLRDLDLAVELVLEHRLGDVDVRRGARPRVLVDRDLAAVLAARGGLPAGRRLLLLLAAGGDGPGKRQCDEQRSGRSSRISHQTSPHC